MSRFWKQARLLKIDTLNLKSLLHVEQFTFFILFLFLIHFSVKMFLT